MISLLAAVPQETSLIRQSLQHTTEETTLGLPIITGQLSGVDICLVHSGIGKAAAAAAAVALLSHCPPEALMLFGCGGAFQGAGLKVGDLALASSEFFGDEGVATPNGFEDLATMGIAMRQQHSHLFNRWPTDQALQEWARPLLSDHAADKGIRVRTGSFVTVSTCTGTTTQGIELEKRINGICENMEGAAVALACHQLSVPMLEVRGISNLVEDRDTSRWDLAAGMTAAQEAVLAILQAWPTR
jgi:futalosine hydrolase